MPGGDRTGPMGMGPMTGRGMGLCAGYPAPAYMHPGSGYGMGRGMGWGRGMRRSFGYGRGLRPGMMPGMVPAYPVVSAAMAPEDEAQFLERDIKGLRDNLKAMEERLAALKKAAT